MAMQRSEATPGSASRASRNAPSVDDPAAVASSAAAAAAGVGAADDLAELNDAAHRDEIVKRLKRAEGQLRGVIRMIDEGEGCLPIAQQLTAVRKALDAALSRMTVCFLEQELADAAKADPAIGRTIEKVGVLISRLG